MNSGSDTRVPPRFVPTLTEVVVPPEGFLSEPLLLPDHAFGEQPAADTQFFEAPTAPAPAVAVPSAETLADRVSRDVCHQLEQQLPGLLEVAARQLQEALPALVQAAVESALSRQADVRLDEQQQRGFSAIHTTDTDRG